MTAPNKFPVILIADDEIAGMRPEYTLNTIRVVAAALGYDPEMMAKHVKFFEKCTGQHGATHYIHTHPENEAIVLAFLDNHFGNETQPNHGQSLISTLQSESQRRGDPKPTMVWISGDHAPDGVLHGTKRALETIHELDVPTIRHKAEHPVKNDNGQSVTIDALRHAFEKIAKFEGVELPGSPETLERVEEIPKAKRWREG